MKQYSLAIVACSAAKLSEPIVVACDLYTSPLFQLARRVAERHAERWLILSARHGVVLPSEPLEPYNLNLTEQSASWRASWGVATWQALQPHLRGLFAEDVLCLAPETYVGELPEQPAWDRPLKGLGIGQQKAKLAELAELEPAPGLSLAELVLKFDAAWPGDEGAEMQLSALNWQRLVQAARRAA